MRHSKPEKMVGAVRFELTTSCTRNKRASQATLRPDLGDVKVPFVGPESNEVFWVSAGRIYALFLNNEFALKETGDWKVARTRRQECLRYVAQAFQPAGSGDFPVPD